MAWQSLLELRVRKKFRCVLGDKAPDRGRAFGAREAVWARRDAYRNMIAFHIEASARFRETGVLGEFPEGTFPPWAGLLRDAGRVVGEAIEAHSGRKQRRVEDARLDGRGHS